MPNSMYELVCEKEIKSLQYFYDNKLDKLFFEMLHIEDIEADNEYGIKPFKFTDEDKIKMIKYVVACFSKDSVYIRTNETAWATKTQVANYLDIDNPLKDMVINYKIKELEYITSKFIDLETDQHWRETMTAKNIYERNLHAANNAIDQAGNIDVKNQKMYYEAAMEFKGKIHDLNQEYQNKHHRFLDMKADFQKSIKSLMISDLIP